MRSSGSLALAVVGLCSACGEPEVDGPTDWRISLELGEDVGALLAVWGRAPDDVFAVGGQEADDGRSSVGAVLHFDGSEWSEVELPPDTPLLNWVFGIDDALWVVGEEGAILRRVGEAWTRHDCATVLPLWGVWGATANDLWAVGGDGRTRPPVLCHFDGSAWAQVQLPMLTADSNGLFKVWGSSADDVVAVGHGGLIVHYDGANWVEQMAGTDLDLIAVWGTSATDVVAVGGRSGGILARYDGQAWQSTELEDVAGLNGVWVDDDGNARLVGGFGTSLALEREELEPVVEPSPTFTLLHATFGFSGRRAFAVGGTLDSPPPYTGIILERGL